MRPDWLQSGTGIALLREESYQVAGAFESIFGDQFLQIGAWGEGQLFRQFARTRRYAVAAARPAPGVDLVSAPEQLAIAPDSIDAVFLPHTLETAEDPHDVLREVDRILRPDGHLVVLGFNPWGWWGLRHYLSRRNFPVGGRRMISEHRLYDWLRLLDYRLEPASFFHFAAPVYRSQVMPEPDRAHPTRRRWHPLASCYLLVASREMLTMTRVRPALRHRRPQLVGGLVNPTTRDAA
jgi:SAM-dependent methyltransferase